MAQLVRRRQESEPPCEKMRRVTVLAYHFWNEDRFDAQFDYLECAVRETWRWCGLLKTILVVNRVTPRLEDFSAAFSGWITLDVEPRLEPGNIHSMSADCNGRLWRRFDTDYVLIVQNDGFPIRPGLETFVGEWDFIGAPYVRDFWWNRLFCRMMNSWVSNGGFSLRTKNICERAAYYWDKKYSTMPACRANSEDIFYTETLPMRERAYRRAVRIADISHARDFSCDAAVSYHQGIKPPFGFHGATAFEALLSLGWISE